MKKFVMAGTLVGALVVGTTAFAQATAEQPAAGQTAEKPSAKTATKKKSSAAADTTAGHTAPKAQPNTTSDATAPGAMALGSVHIPKGLKADGKDLPAGTYQVRLTGDQAKPDAKGSDEQLERWVEFVQGGKVVGREVVSIVPATEAKLVQKDTPPPSGGSKVEALKGGDYTRLWINKAGTYYLVHLTKS
jgi:hypothetical protein